MSRFCPAQPMTGFTWHSPFSWQAYKCLLFTTWRYFVISCVHEYWACSLFVVLQGLFPRNPVGFLVSSGSLFPCPRYVSEWGVFVAFIYFANFTMPASCKCWTQAFSALATARWGDYFIFFTNSLLSDAGKGLKNGRVLTPPLSSSSQLNTHPPPPLPKSQSHINRRDPLYQDVLLLAKKRVYKLIFHHQKFVYRHNNNIKPKKVKSFLDIVVKNDANGISNKLDKFQCNYTSSLNINICGYIWNTCNILPWLFTVRCYFQDSMVISLLETIPFRKWGLFAKAHYDLNCSC